MGITDFFHAIHTVALGELLRVGPLADPDEEHAWSLIDNTYGEDVGTDCIILLGKLTRGRFLRRWLLADPPYTIMNTGSMPQDQPPSPTTLRSCKEPQ